MLDILYNHISYVGIIFVLVISGTGVPIPEEIPVLLAGIATHAGKLDGWLALLSCLTGSLIGDGILYVVGYRFGYGVLREHPWFAHFVTPEREQNIERIIRKHGLKVFFGARFLVGIRSPVFLTAGILRVPFLRFFLADLISASVVIGLFFSLGYFFADRITSWFSWIRRIEVLLTVAVVLAVLGIILYYWRRRQKRWQRVQRRRLERALTTRPSLTPIEPVREPETTT